MTFKSQYGPWALVLGASEGTGRAFALQLAELGLNLFLVARRSEPLKLLVAELERDFQIQCKTLVLDLATIESATDLIQACNDIAIGLVVFNAGADVNNAHFLERSMNDWSRLIILNNMTPLACCHHFASQMIQRGRGGILFIGSGACYGGGPNMATYSGSKAFNLHFVEGLWSELAPFGVDVLYFALGRTDTPMLRSFLEKQGLPIPDDLAQPYAVVEEALAKLPFGPSADFGAADDELGMSTMSAAQRRERVNHIARISQSIFKAK
jgi:short-subunit dehydrogenase